jgi:osmotically-inducible protein OsmY
MSEQRIKKDVVAQLYWDPRVNAANIQVEVRDGRVVLSGTVPTYSARRAATMACLKIEGVRYVQNEITVVSAPDMVPEDEEVRSAIHSHLEWNPEIDADYITVSVDSGQVVLKGTVDSYLSRILAENLAADIRGVTEVNNKLAVVTSDSYEDEAIAGDIRAALGRDVRVEENSVEVAVQDGVVTLSGTVENWSAYFVAQEIAENTAGVKEVVNQLVLVSEQG